MTVWDAIVIGAGHNGLVAAALLAKAGHRTLVVDAALAPGGMARMEELAPGFRVPALAHLVHSLHPEVVRRLELVKHGLAFAAENLPTVVLGEGGEPPIVIRGSKVDGVSATDAAAFAALQARLRRLAGALAPFLTEPPPRFNGAARDLLTLGRLGLSLRRLGREDMREFLRIVLMNAADLVEDELSDPRLAAAVAFDAVLGSGYGPRAPGTVLPLLYRHAGGAAALPRGGMDGVVQALLAAARAAGVEVRLGTKVAGLTVEDDRCAGVVLADGQKLQARRVLSSADPRTTCLDLLGVRHLDTGMVRRLTHLRSRGAAAKLVLAVDGLPEALDRGLLAGRLLHVPSIQRLERASDAVKYGRLSEELMVEAVIPSLSDPSLAPEGGHVVSAVLQYAPYRLDEGWDVGKPKLLEAGIAALDGMLPGLRKRILAARLWTPADIERDFGVAGGHWHHGELVVDQMLMLRPVPGLAQYRTPVTGLYLCGAGSHPGGGVSGVPGLNAASAVLADAA